MRDLAPDATDARVDADTALVIARPTRQPQRHRDRAVGVRRQCAPTESPNAPSCCCAKRSSSIRRTIIVLELLGHLALRVAPRQDAFAVFRRLLERYRWTGLSSPTVLDSVACLLAPADPAAAATLFGGVDARGALPTSAMKEWIERRQLAIETIDAALGPDRRAECSERGAAMPVTQVTNEALDAVVRALDNGT